MIGIDLLIKITFRDNSCSAPASVHGALKGIVVTIDQHKTVQKGPAVVLSLWTNFASNTKILEDSSTMACSAKLQEFLTLTAMTADVCLLATVAATHH